MAGHRELDQNCTKSYTVTIPHQHLLMVPQKSTKLRDHSDLFTASSAMGSQQGARTLDIK